MSSEEGSLLSNDEEVVPERSKIREDLSKMSFEDLQKLKDKVGTKLYNKTLFGVRGIKKNKVFKRANKNRPREMSSKRPVRSQNDVNPVKKKALARDPRFEAMCGTFDKKTFKDNYKFINDIRVKEKKQLEKELNNATDKEEKQRIKFVIQRLDNQIREEEKNAPKIQKTIATEQDLDNKTKPYYKKKSVQKLESLIHKFEDLKKSNKIQKHIERKTKKVAARERKKLDKQNLL